MKKKNFSIAIDGPAGSGKSTISKILAERLNIGYLNTGALYRMVTYACLVNKVDVNNQSDVVNLLPKLKIDVKFDGVNQFNYLDNEMVNDKLFNKTIDENVSVVSSYKLVREKLVDIQRQIARDNSIVVEGRDIGSVVLPNATFKYYLSASPEVRARRRYDEYVKKGLNVDYNTVYKDMIERDYQNTHREISPLVIAKGAIVIDSSNLTIEEVIEVITKNMEG